MKRTHGSRGYNTAAIKGMSEVELNRENKLCASCQLPSTLFCSRCRVTPYCSSQCQKSSWSRHKKACKLNNPTPTADCVTAIVENEDFDRLYSYIIISGANKEAKNTLSDTIGRLTGMKPRQFFSRMSLVALFDTCHLNSFNLC